MKNGNRIISNSYIDTPNCLLQLGVFVYSPIIHCLSQQITNKSF